MNVDGAGAARLPLLPRKMSQYCLLSYSTHAMSASGLGDPNHPCEVTRSWLMDIARRLRFHGQSPAIPDPSFTARAQSSLDPNLFVPR